MKALQLSFARFSRLVDWFVPDDIAADRSMRKQAQLFLVSHLCGPFIGNSVPAAVYLLDPAVGRENLILAASITAFWLFPFLLKYTQQYNILAILSIQNLMFCIFWSCLMLGGIQSPTAPWVLTIPLLSFFYLGSAPDIRLMVLLMFLANFAGFWLLSGTFTVPPSHIGLVPAQVLGLVSTVAASMYIAMMALFYAKALASQGELETEMRDHLATATDLRRAAAEAERADELKAAFLTRLSSDLRLPLYSMIGYSAILIDDVANEADSELDAELKSIRDAGLELLRFVNDVLDLSRIEEGQMEIYSDVFDPAVLFSEVVDEMVPSAIVNGNRLSLNVDGEFGRFSSDMRKVRIVLIQLVSNAIKFTRNGAIDVRVWLRPQDAASPKRLMFCVSDNGIGIEPRKLPKLFELFALNNDSTSSEHGGSGLGLALSQKLCHLLGGDIVVATEPGRGTRFTVTIPTAASFADDLASLAGRQDAGTLQAKLLTGADHAIDLLDVA